jgi:hypothetical protein
MTFVVTKYPPRDSKNTNTRNTVITAVRCFIFKICSSFRQAGFRRAAVKKAKINGKETGNKKYSRRKMMAKINK